MYCMKCGKEIPDEAKFCKYCGSEGISEEQVCSECGTPVANDAGFCENCGAVVGVTNNEKKNIVEQKEVSGITNVAENKPQISVGGIIAIVGGIIGLFYSLITYSNDTSTIWGYTYSSPLTSHEVGVIVIGVFSAVAIIVGIAPIAIQKKNA